MLRPSRVVLAVAVRERILRASDAGWRRPTPGGSRWSTFSGSRCRAGHGRPVEIGTAEISENDSMVVRLASQIIVDAHRARASDIHLEPRGRAGSGDPLPHRRHVPRLPAHSAGAAESAGGSPEGHGPPRHRRASQARRTGRSACGSRARMRSSSAWPPSPPSAATRGHACCASWARRASSCQEMGLSDRNLRELKGIAEKPYGLILCVGPTGAGKADISPCRAGPHQGTGSKDLDGGGPGGDHPGWAPAGAGASQDRVHLRRRHARHAARRPRRHHGRRDARRETDGLDGGGLAHAAIWC